jgi:DNA-binding NarL/FixJ family response regulator
MRPKNIRILLADDNPAIRSALALLLETRLKIDEINETDNLNDLAGAVERFQPDILILDWELPGPRKKNRVKDLRLRHPALKVVVTSSRPEVAGQFLAAQADSYVCKCEPPELVVEVIQGIMDSINGTRGGKLST